MVQHTRLYATTLERFLNPEAHLHHHYRESDINTHRVREKRNITYIIFDEDFLAGDSFFADFGLVILDFDAVLFTRKKEEAVAADNNLLFVDWVFFLRAGAAVRVAPAADEIQTLNDK